jgi:hypothetical protein
MDRTRLKDMHTQVVMAPTERSDGRKGPSAVFSVQIPLLLRESEWPVMSLLPGRMYCIGGVSSSVGTTFILVSARLLPKH